jgi:Arc/MetJ-type ribon-helix-helix transcriptional regulator
MAKVVPPQSSPSRAEKVSVSLPGDLSEEVRRRVGRRGFSRFVAAAVRRQIERDDLDALLAEMEAVNGPVPPELLAEVDRLWPVGAAARR